MLKFDDGYISVPARPISEGAAPCPYWLICTAPCPNLKKYINMKKKKFILFLFLQNVIAVFVFSDS